MSETAGEVLSRTVLKLGGKKSLGHKWQWRRTVILIEAKLRYWDAKTETYRGELSLEGAECAMITEKDDIYFKLAKLKRPKVPEGVVDIINPSFFSIKPRDSLKTYYFGVPISERSLWIGYINDAREGMKGFREALRLKRGAATSLSPASSASNLLGNLQPIGGGPGMNQPQGVHYSSISSAGSGEGSGSISSLGPASGRSWASIASIHSGGSSTSTMSTASTWSSNHNDPASRLTTIETGMMPGTSIGYHSASAPPPARQVVAPQPNMPLTPRDMPLDEDPFGLMVPATSTTGTSPAASTMATSPVTSTLATSPVTSTMATSPILSTTPLDQSSTSLLYPVPSNSPSTAASLDTSTQSLEAASTTSTDYNPALVAHPHSASSTTTPISSPSPSPAPGTPTVTRVIPGSPALTFTPRNSPSPFHVGTTVVGTMPQPILSQSSSSLRDSFVFDSVL